MKLLEVNLEQLKQTTSIAQIVIYIVLISTKRCITSLSVTESCFLEHLIDWKKPSTLSRLVNYITVRDLLCSY
jgi:hypothetical protein